MAARDTPGRRARVHVIYTGGTLGMKPSPEAGGSLAPAPGYLEAQMTTMQELQVQRDNACMASLGWLWGCVCGSSRG